MGASGWGFAIIGFASFDEFAHTWMHAPFHRGGGGGSGLWEGGRGGGSDLWGGGGVSPSPLL